MVSNPVKSFQKCVEVGRDTIRFHINGLCGIIWDSLDSLECSRSFKKF